MYINPEQWSYVLWLWKTFKDKIIVIAAFLAAVQVQNPALYDQLIQGLALPFSATMVLGLIISVAKFNGWLPRIGETTAKKLG